QSNRHNVLGQMLLTNQRLDKLKAACNDFVHQGLLPPSHAPPPKPMLMPDKDEDGGLIDEHVTGTVTLARMCCTSIILSLMGLAQHINQPDLVELTCRFLHDQLYPDGPPANKMELEECSEIHTKISVFGSAIATFYAPSDECGLQGMQHERIWSTHLWRNQGPCRDCALVIEDDTKPG
ncbi:hypothetical protein BGY98DRAFT_913797, partial [Russula aff. rugulosa BPL654]